MEPGCLPELSKQIREFDKVKRLRFTGDSTEKERGQRHRNLNTHRGSPSSLKLNTVQENCVKKKKLSNARERKTWKD